MRSFPSFVLVSLAASLVAAACSSADPSAAPESPAAARDRAPGDAGGAGPGAAADVAATAADLIATPHEGGGSRLRPVYLQRSGSDGSVELEFRGFFDRERAEDCSIAQVGEKHYCVPYAERPLFSPEAYFEDAACASPVVGFYPDEPRMCERVMESKRPTRYFEIAPSDKSTCAPAKIAAVASERLVLRQIFRKVGSACEVVSLTRYEDIPFYRAASPFREIDRASFVELTLAGTPALEGNGRVRAGYTRWSGADGSFFDRYDGLVDSQRNELCNSATDAAGTLRCLPRATRIRTGSPRYVDASCTRRGSTLEIPAPSCVPWLTPDPRDTAGRYMTAPADDAGVRTTIYPHFTTAPLATVYVKAVASVCSAQTPPVGGIQVFAESLPSPLDPSAFAEGAYGAMAGPADTGYVRGGSRLRPVASGFTGPDSQSAVTTSLVDPELEGARCFARYFEDGTIGCVADTDSFALDPSEGYYADAACAVPVVGTSRSSDASRRYLESRALETKTCFVSQIYVRPANELTTSAIYTVDSSSRCVATGMVPGDYRLYRRADVKLAEHGTFVTQTLARIER